MCSVSFSSNKIHSEFWFHVWKILTKNVWFTSFVMTKSFSKMTLATTSRWWCHRAQSISLISLRQEGALCSFKVMKSKSIDHINQQEICKQKLSFTRRLFLLHCIYPITHLAWSNEAIIPSWVHGILVGWTSVPEAWTDWSSANSNAPAPPATAPIDAKS